MVSVVEIHCVADDLRRIALPQKQISTGPHPNIVPRGEATWQGRPMRALLLCVLVLCASTLAHAQGGRVEVFGGGSLWWPSQDGAYQVPYTPSRVIGIGQLFGERDPRSSAQQTLVLNAEPGGAVAVGTDLFLHRLWGVQLMVERARVSLGGKNPPHRQVELVDVLCPEDCVPLDRLSGT
jgi:hypothetical protein